MFIYMFKSDGNIIKNGQIYKFSSKKMLIYLLQIDPSIILLNSIIKKIIKKSKRIAKKIKFYKNLYNLRKREYGIRLKN